MHLSFSRELCWQLDTIFLNAAAAKYNAISPFTLHYFAFLSWVSTVSVINCSWHTTVSISKEKPNIKRFISSKSFRCAANRLWKHQVLCLSYFPLLWLLVANSSTALRAIKIVKILTASKKSGPLITSHILGSHRCHYHRSDNFNWKRNGNVVLSTRKC